MNNSISKGVATSLKYFLSQSMSRQGYILIYVNSLAWS